MEPAALPESEETTILTTKTMKTIGIISFALIFILLGHSCFAQNENKADKKLNRKVSVKKYTDISYPATDEVEIFRTNKPQKPYIEIAQIETSASRKDGIELFTSMAKKLGGDAIIMVGEENRGAVAVPIGTMVYAVPVTALVAIVIKFKTP